MQIAICHYSFCRSCQSKQWSLDRVAQEVAAMGVTAIDFHVNMIGAVDGAVELIKDALSKHDLVLAGISLANNFNLPTPELSEQIETAKQWLRVAGQVHAPVARIFGGSIPYPQRMDPTVRQACRPQILHALGQMVPEAEKHGVILGLENHGGMPCTAEEQVDIIKQINSPYFKATIDVGNYMQGGQEGHVAARIAGEYAAYVHFKDFQKVSDDHAPWGWRPEKCSIVGTGEVDHAACLQAIKESGYKGFVALEYEGNEDEATGVQKSVQFMKDLMQEYEVVKN